MNPTRKRAIEELRRTVLAALGEHDAAVWLFGSWRFERERIAIGSPGTAIRASRQVGWLSDEDAEALLKDRSRTQPHRRYV